MTLSFQAPHLAFYHLQYGKTYVLREGGIVCREGILSMALQVTDSVLQVAEAGGGRGGRGGKEGRGERGEGRGERGGGRGEREEGREERGEGRLEEYTTTML